MAEIIYGLCALTAMLCTCLLLYAYVTSRYRMLLWGGLCFMGLTISNILVIVDEVLIPMGDLSTERLVTALISMVILIYGLIVESN